MDRLKGKVAVIVGGGGTAIGRATVARFHAEGATVVCADREKDAEQSAATVRSVVESGGASRGFPVDLLRGDSIAAMLRATVHAYGRLDVLFNVAVPGRAPAGDEYEWVLKGAFVANYYGTVYAAPLMAANGGGSIINISSVSGVVLSPSLQPLPADLPPGEFPLPGRGIGAYGAGKHGVLHFSREAAVLYGRHQIRVNVIAPGFMATPFTLNSIQGDRKTRIEAAIPLGAFGRAEDIAATAAFLASDDSRYVTGQLIVVDGGFSARSV